MYFCSRCTCSVLLVLHCTMLRVAYLITLRILHSNPLHWGFCIVQSRRHTNRKENDCENEWDRRPSSKDFFHWGIWSVSRWSFLTVAGRPKFMRERTLQHSLSHNMIVHVRMWNDSSHRRVVWKAPDRWRGKFLYGLPPRRSSHFAFLNNSDSSIPQHIRQRLGQDSVHSWRPEPS